MEKEIALKVRVNTDVHFSTLCSSPVLSGPTTSQSANKQLERSEASGGLTYDLKIENIDIAYGHKYVVKAYVCIQWNLSNQDTLK